MACCSRGQLVKCRYTIRLMSLYSSFSLLRRHLLECDRSDGLCALRRRRRMSCLLTRASLCVLWGRLLDENICRQRLMVDM